MKKIISLITSAVLAGHVGYITPSYAASSQESSKSKHSSSKKPNKSKTTKNTPDKSEPEQTKKSKSDKKNASSKKDTTESNKKKKSSQNKDSVDKSNRSKQTTPEKSKITPVSSTVQKNDPVTEKKSSEVAITPTQTNTPEPIVPTANPIPVDCVYQLSSTALISEKELAEWAQLAILKSFDYSFDTLETQLQKLKACYTEQGWLAFNDALRQSGNLATIKAQQLTVSCEIEGKLKVDPFKNNQWKITVPVKVVYQNTQEKLTQRLYVAMLVTKKSSSQLGVVQIIAEPKSQNASKEQLAS